jgi:hypothetical protein
MFTVVTLATGDIFSQSARKTNFYKMLLLKRELAGYLYNNLDRVLENCLKNIKVGAIHV